MCSLFFSALLTKSRSNLAEDIDTTKDQEAEEEISLDTMETTGTCLTLGELTTLVLTTLPESAKEITTMSLAMSQSTLDA